MQNNIRETKVAIVYDWIDKWGGVERILLTLHEMFPDAEFFTSYYDNEKAIWAKNLKIRTSFIQKLPNFIKKNRLLSLLFYPYAFESFNFNEYDLVISVTSSFAKSIITQPKTLHLCYLLTPTRFLWSHREEYVKLSYLLFVNGYLEKLKKWDRVVSQRPDRIISISKTVAERCRKYYGRESEVIYPPFDRDYWSDLRSKIKNQKSQLRLSASMGEAKLQIKSKKYFLVVSRLEKYKKIDLVIRTFNELSNLNLIVVGKGTEEDKLKQMAGKNVQFLRDLSDQELGSLYSQAEALIIPQEEDFGYVSLEAQFFGCPVIFYDKGGASETVIDGEVGLSFVKQTTESLTGALERFSKMSYNLRQSTLRLGCQNIERFSRKIFEIDIKNIIMSNIKAQMSNPNVKSINLTKDKKI